MVLGSSEAIREPFTSFLTSPSLTLCSYSNLVSSKTSRTTYFPPQKYPPKDLLFKEWLAGLIDGDGCLLLSKKGYGSLEITMSLQDEHTLQIIKNRYGGSIKLRSGVKAVRYRLHHKEGLLQLISDINGFIRHSNRLIQLNSLCVHYGLQLIHPEPLHSFFNGWLSGFFDADGTVTLNSSNHQFTLSISQKDKYLLDALIPLYGGSVYIDRGQHLSFKWYITSQEAINNILDYFKVCPSRSFKKNRLAIIPKLLELKGLKAHLAPTDSLLAKAWSKAVTAFHSE